MFDWFRRMFGPSELDKMIDATKREPQLPPEPKPELEPWPRCTYCGGVDFYEGPSGGMSTNILCANDQCRHKFNCTPMLRQLDDLHSTWERRLED
jgi:hypothetical protein